MEFLTAAYPWLKWLHLLALISWMVGLFYLPRLFVYHAESSEAAVHATLETMEYKLMKVIMTPAMLVTWLSGILLIASIGASGGWIWIKIAIVFGRCLWQVAKGAGGGHVYPNGALLSHDE